MGRKLRNAWAARLLEGNQAAPAAAAGKGRAGPVRLAGASVTSAARTPAANASTAPIRILGLDTALRCTGFGVIDTDGQRFAAVDCGLIRIPASAALSECLRRLSGGVVELLDRFAPDVIAIEGGFFFKNVKTATVLGMARGAVVARLAERRLPVYEYAPRRVKQAVCGHGGAGKQQVALLVSQILGIPVTEIKDDATDALAVAVCHAQTAYNVQGLLLPKPL